jgi:hypothetical protein
VCVCEYGWVCVGVCGCVSVCGCVWVCVFECGCVCVGVWHLVTAEHRAESDWTVGGQSKRRMKKFVECVTSRFVQYSR